MCINFKRFRRKKYKDLPASIKNKLDYKAQINVEILDVSKNEELEYEVFRRFNIVDRMKAVKFGEFGGVSSTSYRVEKQCIDSVKKSLSNLRLNKLIQ